jgi:hypothetical protein
MAVLSSEDASMTVRPCLVLLTLLLGCEGPIGSAPAALWAASPSDGRTRFFAAFAVGDHAGLPPIISTLSAEHLAGDRVSTAVLGFAHAWWLAESSRVGNDPTVIGSASVAQRFLDTAHEAFPDDPRLLGFQGSMMMAEGSINADAARSRDGYLLAKSSSVQWPQWGLFTLAYSLSTQPPTSDLGREALDAMWRNLEVCAEGRAFSRTSTESLAWFERTAQSANPLVARACGDQSVAPFNLEGFFAVFGDLLARAGDVTQATRMYDTALSTETSTRWPYRTAIERRRAEVNELAARWAVEPPRGGPRSIDQVTLFSGPANCTLCHQRSP